MITEVMFPYSEKKMTSKTIDYIKENVSNLSPHGHVGNSFILKKGDNRRYIIPINSNFIEMEFKEAESFESVSRIYYFSESELITYIDSIIKQNRNEKSI